MSDHLTAGEPARIAAFLPARERALLGHALDCPPCGDRVGHLLALEPPTELGDRLPTEEYGEALDRLAASLEELAERVAAERALAEPAVTALLALPAAERRKRVRAEARFRTLPVAYLLLDHALSQVEAAPEESENLALLAVYVLGKLDPEQTPATLAAELKVRGWAVVAKSCWMRGEWLAVREALEYAEEIMVSEGYVTRRVGFRRVLAALRLIERRVHEAVAVGGRAVDLLLGRLAVASESPDEKES